jgi:cytochrome P450
MSSLYFPPAPKPRTHALGPLSLLATLRRNPLECWTKRHFEEPIVEGGLPFGRVLLVNEPGAVRRVLLENAANYRKDRLQRRVLSAGMKDGLLSVEGAAWKAQRHVVAPVFALRTVREFAPAMMGAAEAMTARWPDGEAVDLAVEMRRITLEVLERTIFTDGFGAEAEDIRLAMDTYFRVIGQVSPLDLIGAPNFVPRQGRWCVRSTLRFFESAIDDLIAARRRLLASNPDGAPRDILTLLLQAADDDSGALSEAEVRSNVLTFFAAGHETTANALCWALFLLSQSPEWRRRVERESARVLGGSPSEAVDELTDCRAVIEEAIRLYPPIAAMSRVALGDDELAGVKVRRGTLVVISPWVLHRHKLLWDNPDAFDPRRFESPARGAIDRFAYLPFGAGPRTCIGSPFAMQEAAIVLATIVSRFSLQLSPDQTVWPLLQVTLRPADGLRMIVRRKPAADEALKAG